MNRSQRFCRQLANQVFELDDIHAECLMTAYEEIEQVFTTLDKAAEELKEPKLFAKIKQLPPEIQKDWIKAVVKEFKFIISNKTLDKDSVPEIGDEANPAMLVFKAKITSRGFLDKLKA